ncbi:MAG: hypothetical protein ABIJ21_02910 [Nanoarchaeota archaeon]
MGARRRRITKKEEKNQLRIYLLIFLYGFLFVLLLLSFTHLKKIRTGHAFQTIPAEYYLGEQAYVDGFILDVWDNPGIEYADMIVWDEETRYHPEGSLGTFASPAIDTREEASQITAQWNANHSALFVEVSTDDGMTWCQVKNGETLTGCNLPARSFRYRVILTESTAIDSITFNWSRHVTSSTTRYAAEENQFILGNNSAPQVTLISPPDNHTTNQSTINISCIAEDPDTLVSISLFLMTENSPWALRETTTTNTTNATSTFNISLTDANYTWNCKAMDTLNNSGYAPAYFTFHHTICQENWTCTPLSARTCGLHTCTDENGCGTTVEKPLDEVPCQEEGTTTQVRFIEFDTTPPDPCTDGKDNEGFPPEENGCLDEKDHACGGQETACWGGIDEDCDGRSDCDDDDCLYDDNCIIHIETPQEVRQIYTAQKIADTYTQTETPRQTHTTSFSSFQSLENYFTFLNWLLVAIICTLLITLLVIHHVKVPHHPPPALASLEHFIQEKKREGWTDQEIKKKLEEAGWIENVIDSEFNHIEKSKRL